MQFSKLETCDTLAVDNHAKKMMRSSSLTKIPVEEWDILGAQPRTGSTARMLSALIKSDQLRYHMFGKHAPIMISYENHDG